MSFPTIVAHGLAHEGLHALGVVGQAITYGTNAIAPIRMPEMDQLIHMTQRGWLDEVSLNGLAINQGVQINPLAGFSFGVVQSGPGGMEELWNRYYYATGELPSVHEYFTIANRNLYGDQVVADRLRKYGFLDPKLRDEVSLLRYDIPGPSDLVRFSVRHVFEPELIAKLGYDDEYNQALDVWHQFQGLNYEIWTGALRNYVNKWEVDNGFPAGYWESTYATWDVPEPTWARAYWWSHWVLPSPTFGYLALQRLRPTRDPTYDTPEMLGINFDLADLRLLLRANDYPPIYRDMMAALSRPIPGIRFAREFRTNGVYDYNALVEWALRQGYGDADAVDIATDIDQAAQKKKAAATHGKGKAQVVEALCLGAIDGPGAQHQLENWGEDPATAALTVSIAQLGCDMNRLRRIVAATRKQFLSGQLDGNQALAQLNNAGVLPAPAQDYLAEWQVEKLTNVKQISAQKAVRWACDGFISLAELGTRLTNLGYATADVVNFEAEAQMCILSNAAKAAAKQQTASDKSARKLLECQRAAAENLRAARRALAAHGTPTQIRKWFCSGHIGTQEVYDRLTWLGWPDTDIARLISDCKSGTPGATAPTGRQRATGPFNTNQFGEIVPPTPPGCP